MVVLDKILLCSVVGFFALSVSLIVVFIWLVHLFPDDPKYKIDRVKVKYEALKKAIADYEANKHREQQKEKEREEQLSIIDDLYPLIRTRRSDSNPGKTND
jgi:hypothetical protein